ncbi:Vmc-like lipoprotein signal peptide domain-containing protein [Mycoplasma bradburyae]|uniref:Haemagglutinin Mycoplasma domain-containing protein n=1 Tax=Mycoplasma bradburyae TaxID=2963128 RepID=A0ABT5GA79_9MOLU|nr:hypothetical protein [Mycoplasma bradburyae]MDC4181768.1 hypothetical protein [Mycoplasma bradburyae]UTS69806.1 hypothetical protein NMG68_02150 [Mycoplasma bradburyae]
MKQKTKKLLQLSFSLGFLATTALVATSCNQPKTVTPKPTNPMQPENGSGTGTTPGTGETMQPGNGSGSGTGTTTPDNTEAKNQLKALIDKENDNVGLYADYSAIKSKLVEAYTLAKEINNKTNATVQELTDAKTTLETAVNKAETDKMAFNAANSELVTAYGTLKTTVSEKDSKLSSLSGMKYEGLKTYLGNLYKTAEDIIENSLQANGLTKEQVNDANMAIISSITNLDMKKQNVDEYSAFKLFAIENGNFKGNLKYSSTSPENQSIIGFASDFNNDQTNEQTYSKWKYAKRVIKNTTSQDSSEKTNVTWIYNLNTQTSGDAERTPATYEFNFEYYGSNTAYLFFPYKAIKNDQKGDNLSLKYKLNNEEQFVTIDVSAAKVDDISIAKVNLSNLNFGMNKITFTTEENKIAPMIGNMYITASEESSNLVYNDIFGNEITTDNPDEITVNFAKGYGLANKGIGVPNHQSTIITKLTGKIVNTDNENKNYYLLGYLGNSVSGGNDSNGSIYEKYYIFYVNAPKEGVYNISGIYNSGEDNRGLTFWKDQYGASGNGNIAKFSTPMTGDWSNTLKSFNKEQKVDSTSGSLHLIKGLNKIIVSGRTWNKEAPNLGNITFTLEESATPPMMAGN